jgi:hypothetical protein
MAEQSFVQDYRWGGSFCHEAIGFPGAWSWFEVEAKSTGTGMLYETRTCSFVQALEFQAPWFRVGYFWFDAQLAGSQRGARCAVKVQWL